MQSGAPGASEARMSGADPTSRTTATATSPTTTLVRAWLFRTPELKAASNGAVSRGTLAHVGHDEIGRAVSDNRAKACEISQPTDSSPIRLLPGSLVRR